MRYITSLLLGLCLAPFGAAALGHHQSGMIGQTTLGEICDLDGNCVPNVVPMNVAIYSDTGRFIADIATDENGVFEIALKPGSYILTPYFPPAPPERGFIALGGPIPVTIDKKEYRITLVPFYPFSPIPGRPPNVPPPPPSPPQSG